MSRKGIKNKNGTHKLTKKVCPSCGKTFKPERYTQKFCCKECWYFTQRIKERIKDNTLQCSCCKQVKPVEDFYKNKSVVGGVGGICRSCKKQQRWKDNLKTSYNITPEQYFEMLKNQGGGCAICGKKPEQEKRKLSVDHNHKTGFVRGVLCNFCNGKLLGRLRDNKKKAEGMIVYLSEALKNDTKWEY